MSDDITLTEDLYDHRDKNRSPVFVAGKGATVPRKVAEALGLKIEKPAVKARKEAEVEDKAVKPADTKSVRSKKA